MAAGALPDACIEGLDYLAYLSQSGVTKTYLMGAIHTDRVWYYTPLALAWKWPLGFLGLLALGAGWSLARRRDDFGRGHRCCWRRSS